MSRNNLFDLIPIRGAQERAGLTVKGNYSYKIGTNVCARVWGKLGKFVLMNV